MKSLVLILFLLTSVFTSKSVDTTSNRSIIEYKFYQNTSYINWSKSGVGYWTSYSNYSVYNDFDWMVSRSNAPDYNGYYYYYIWFYSQSFYWNGYDKKYTSTNIVGMKLYVNNYLVISDNSPLGITFMNEYNASLLTFKSKSPTVKINIVWKNMSAK